MDSPAASRLAIAKALAPGVASAGMWLFVLADWTQRTGSLRLVAGATFYALLVMPLVGVLWPFAFGDEYVQATRDCKDKVPFALLCAAGNTAFWGAGFWLFLVSGMGTR